MWRYNWNIVESSIKHNNNNPISMFYNFKSLVAIYIYLKKVHDEIVKYTRDDVSLMSI